MANKEIKIVVSDIHMGTGARPGLVNPLEDFHHDERLSELILHYCQGEFANIPVEFIIAGDFLDLLKVLVHGRFETQVTEDIAVEKVRRCILGHPMVFDALATFVSVPHKRITYIIGNHDMDVAFPRVQSLIKARLGNPSDGSLAFVTEQSFYRLPGGVVVTHGHLFEALNTPSEEGIIKQQIDGKPIINMPWGSRFFTEVLAPFKTEQPLIDLVHPLSSFLLWGLVFDLRFTLRVLYRIMKFLLKTPIKATYKGMGLIKTLQIAFEEIALYNNVENRAYKLIRSQDDISILIMGHSHFAQIRRFPRNKLFINTGTWVKIVSLDLANLGTRNYLTYALVEYGESGSPNARLLRWRGRSREKEDILA